MAQAQRHYEQAQQYYQQALDIKIKFGDRFSQASTYSHLGQVAEETNAFENAKAYFLEALKSFFEFDDKRGLSISKRHLARFYQATQDQALLTEAAEILNITSSELEWALAMAAAADGPP